jgi:kumamolisin
MFKRILLPSIALTFTTTAAHADQAVVRVKQRISMAELAREVSDPASPRYHQFYSPEEIGALAGPTEAEYNGLVAQLQARELKITSESPTHLWIGVEGSKANLTSLNERAQSAFSSLDFSATRLVDSVHGVNKGLPRHPLFHRYTGDSQQFSGNTPDVIRKFYGFDKVYAAGFTGKGQHIAIATYDDFNLDDVNQYYTKNNISTAQRADKVSFNGKATYDEGSAAETELDAEFSGMVAPDALIHVFTSAQNSDAGEAAMFTAILDDNRAKIANYSWGSCDDTVDPAHRKAMQDIFARAVAQGVNIVIASGDSGSSCNGDGKTVADFQASSPFVVAVGGTTIPKGANGDETAWSGSGGGISTVYDLPDYQKTLGAPFSKRSYPDVAFNADPASGQPVWTHYNSTNAIYIVVGGTSIAAPQWSGFLALVGEARGAKPLGFLNPALYGLNETSRDSALHDVVSGSNGAYKAAKGFDAVTGLGSMKGDTLFDLLRTN